MISLLQFLWRRLVIRERRPISISIEITEAALRNMLAQCVKSRLASSEETPHSLWIGLEIVKGESQIVRVSVMPESRSQFGTSAFFPGVGQ